MNRGAVAVLVLSGLCFLPSCFPRTYFLVPESHSWAAAQSYCRSRYTDLATVQNQQEVVELNRLIGGLYYVWIGLNAVSEGWRWSLENQDYYSAGGASFTMWSVGYPSGSGNDNACVVMFTNGQWMDQVCSNSFPFICYKGSAAALDPSPSFIYVNQLKTWIGAQQYCRLHYTDLASVRNQAENDQMKAMLQNQYTWIGFYKNSWKWSDGSPVPVSNWLSRNPTSSTSNKCVVSYFGRWTNIACSTQCYSACFLAQTWKQVLRLQLKKSDSVDVGDVKDDMLKKFEQIVKDQIQNPEVDVKWVKHPDGKIFYKKNVETMEEPFK